MVENIYEEIPKLIHANKFFQEGKTTDEFTLCEWTTTTKMTNTFQSSIANANELLINKNPS